VLGATAGYCVVLLGMSLFWLFEDPFMAPTFIVMAALVGAASAAVSLPAVMLGVAALGLPAHRALLRGGRTGAVHYLGSGLLAGALLAAVFAFFATAGGGAREALLYSPAFLAGGPAAAWGFWRTRRPDRDRVA